jgi:HK97 family phage portal protein
MSFYRRTLQFFGVQGVQKRVGLQAAQPSGYSQASAAVVTFDTAMTISAFWASVRLLSEVISAMPLVCYKTENKTSERDDQYRLWRVLNYRPNRYQTRTEFFETMVLNLCTTGNSYHAIQRDEDGEVLSLLPLMSAQMNLDLLLDGTPVYRYHDAAGNVRIYSEESIWHVKLFGNGIIGLSPLGHARQSLGIAIAADNRMGKLASSGGKTSGVLMVDKVLTPDQRAAIRQTFQDITQGNDDNLFVLEANMQYQQTSMSPADIQLLETRKFQIEDIARFIGVPSVLINDTAGSTGWGSGIEQLVEGFYKLNLRPYLERIECSLKRHLMPEADWDRYEIEFDFDSLLRADLAARMESYQKGINAGVYTPDEARGFEGLPPKPGGDRLLVNGTMVPVDQVRARPAQGAPT